MKTTSEIPILQKKENVQSVCLNNPGTIISLKVGYILIILISKSLSKKQHDFSYKMKFFFKLLKTSTLY
jgi:hypothetical protein